MRAGRILALVGLPAFAAAAQAQGPDWHPVSNAAEGSFTVEFYVDATSLCRQGNVVEFIERAEFTDHQLGWKQVISQSQVDCRLNRAKTVRMRITRTNGKVEVLDQRKVARWAAIPAGTNGAFVRDYVCGK